MATLQLHAHLTESQANGPGNRMVVWFQGCSLGCPGCFNPKTHSPKNGNETTVEAVLDQLSQRPQIEGLTVSGGEPFEQPAALRELCKGAQERGLTVIVFSGFQLEEIQTNSAMAPALSHIDVLIDGRYQANERLAQGMRGSRNQQIHYLSSQYGPADFEQISPLEATISPDGTIQITGVDGNALVKLTK